MEAGKQLKTELLALARTQVQGTLAATEDALARLAQSLANETKSSAGDKFETGRAMIHLEQQKLNQQLAASMERNTAIGRIARKEASSVISEGSLVATNRGLYFVGLALGKVRINGRIVFCTSLDSPIGAQLLGKEVGEAFVFNKLDFLIKGVA